MRQDLVHGYFRRSVKEDFWGYMNTQTENTNTMRIFLVAAAAVVMLLLVSITPTFGQKEQAERATTRDGLTETGFMTNPEISDDLDGTGDEYFYKFQARAGKLTVTLEVAANETNAGATLDLFSVNSKAILSNMLAQGVDGGSERVSKSVTIAKAQDIIIRIKGLKYGSSAGYPAYTRSAWKGRPCFTDVAPPEALIESTSRLVRPMRPSSSKPAATPPMGGPSQNAGELGDGPVESKTRRPQSMGRVKQKARRGGSVIEKGEAKSISCLSSLKKVKTKIPTNNRMRLICWKFER